MSENLKNLTYQELRKLAKAAGIEAHGKKMPQLIEELEAVSNDETGAVTTLETEKVEAPKVPAKSKDEKRGVFVKHQVYFLFF